MATNFTILQTAQCSSSVLCNTACLTLCLHTQDVHHLSTIFGHAALSPVCSCYYCLNTTAAAITTEKHSHTRICVCSYFRKPHLSHKDFAVICIVSTNSTTRLAATDSPDKEFHNSAGVLIRTSSFFTFPTQVCQLAAVASPPCC